MTVAALFEVELLIDPVADDRGVAMFHVKCDDGLDIFLFHSLDVEGWIATAPLRGFHGCRVPVDWRHGMPSLPAIVAAAFPDLVAAPASPATLMMAGLRPPVAA